MRCSIYYNNHCKSDLIKVGNPSILIKNKYEMNIRQLLLDLKVVCKIKADNTDEYYFNFYNPIVWIIIALNPITVIAECLYSSLKEIVSEIKRCFIADVKEEFTRFKKYEKLKREKINK